MEEIIRRGEHSARELDNARGLLRWRGDANSLPLLSADRLGGRRGRSTGCPKALTTSLLPSWADRWSRFPP
eukprot:766808-Hanusia_phi.AAC.7